MRSDQHRHNCLDNRVMFRRGDDVNLEHLPDSVAQSTFWEFFGEGQSTVVFAYVGSDPVFTGKVLYAQKEVLNSEDPSKSLWYHDSFCALFNTLLPIPVHISYHVTSLFLEQLNTVYTRSFVVESPTSSRIDPNSTHVSITNNLSLPMKDFVPRRRSNSIPRRQKGTVESTNDSSIISLNASSGMIEQTSPLTPTFSQTPIPNPPRSTFCPVQLFSSSTEEELEQAMHHLLFSPQNNFKVFLNGTPVFPLSASRISPDRFERTSNDPFAPEATVVRELSPSQYTLNSTLSLSGWTEDNLIQYAARALHQSSVLNTLRQLQSLDEVGLFSASLHYTALRNFIETLVLHHLESSLTDISEDTALFKFLSEHIPQGHSMTTLINRLSSLFSAPSDEKPISPAVSIILDVLLDPFISASIILPTFHLSDSSPQRYHCSCHDPVISNAMDRLVGSVADLKLWDGIAGKDSNQYHWDSLISRFSSSDSLSPHLQLIPPSSNHNLFHPPSCEPISTQNISNTIRILRGFLLSDSANDCSIIITFSPSLNTDTHTYPCTVNVIDFAPKCHTRFPRWLVLERRLTQLAGLLESSLS
ncbi:putative Inositol-pentakisphosphate 2-kinase [Blattamonas nauphoetae]|uniref:Inositol-pentakisphosphate 2-kinase n=1 Tax=Blattamonas nauphoetae TaxID=2049346 RepID=A0ABQ9XZ01_9EUKA|nr:putative Inositol-pentakisphosphate 2-kinase [Blattamonas nauphoetae]